MVENAPKKNKKQNSPLQLIKETTKTLLDLLAIKNYQIKISEDEKGTVGIDIDCPQPALLIGFKGEVISSLQLILSILVYKKIGRWQPLLVNVADYRQKREESLRRLALNSAQKVKFSGQEVVLPYLRPVERRIIHLILADNPEVITESRGEDRERRLVIKPKSKEDKNQ